MPAAGSSATSTRSRDYSDYSYFYDKYFASGCNWITQSGYQYLKTHPAAYGNCYGGTPYPAADFTEPQEYVITNGHYTKWANELRVTTPQDEPGQGTLGRVRAAPGARDLGAVHDPRRRRQPVHHRIRRASRRA